jgi:hypothetical protein
MQHKTTDSQSGNESAETVGPLTGGGVKTADLTGETAGSVPPAAAIGELREGVSPPGEDRTEATGVDLVPSFLHEIARTMQAAVARERGRIAVETANTLEAHVEKVRLRAATEAAELKRLAEEDVNHIREWSAGEAERLRRETQSRIGARRENLDRHLRQHDSLVEREISGANEAVEQYRAELDRFVASLASEQEPTEIARLAKQLPEPPRVEDIASAARADAIAELSRSEAASDKSSTGPDVVGVMDPKAVSKTAGPKAQERASTQSDSASAQKDSAPAPFANVSSEDEPVVQERRMLILGARNRADLALRLVLVLSLAVLIGILVVLVMSGQAQAASSHSLSRGI